MRTRSLASTVAQQTGASVGEVLAALSTGHDDSTQFFSITATHTDPEKAQNLANAAAQALIAQNLARQQAQKEQIEAQRDPLKVQEQQRLQRLQQSLEDRTVARARAQDERAFAVAQLEAETRERTRLRTTVSRALLASCDLSYSLATYTIVEKWKTYI